MTAILRFDSGPRRMPAAAAEALRGAVLELVKSDAVVIAFEQKGMALLDAGKIREELTEFRALAEKHPKEAIHRGQIARALLAAGLGESAREEARNGIAMQPASAAAHATLGFVLQHDLLGRLRKKGFDYAGAEAEYLNAIEIYV